MRFLELIFVVSIFATGTLTFLKALLAQMCGFHTDIRPVSVKIDNFTSQAKIFTLINILFFRTNSHDHRKSHRGLDPGSCSTASA